MPDVSATIIAAMIAIVGVLLSTIVFALYQARRSATLEKEQLNLIQREREQINVRIMETDKEEPKKNIVDIIQLGLNHLTEYYVINKGQAKNSFRLSVSLIVIGFLTIIFGVSILYSGQLSITLATVSGISGVLLQFIGGASFFVYRKSLEQLNFYYNQLIKMQDTMLAIQLIENLPSQEKHLDLMEKLILALLTRSSKESTMVANSTDVLNIGASPNNQNQTTSHT